MFSDKHYVSAIRWRQGEFGALEELTAAQKELITPLVDIAPIPWDFEEEQPSRTIDQHLLRVPPQMAQAWGNAGPIFVDLGLVDNVVRMANGRHPLDDLFERLSVEGIEAIPVIATDRDADYQNAVRLVAQRDGSGVCLRASADDLADAASIGILEEIAADLEIPLEQVDLVLDFRTIDPGQVSLLRTLVASILGRLSNLLAYRTLTLLSGAFPVNLSSLSQGISLLHRADWSLWLSVRSATLARQPSYGDYTASHPDQEEIDPRLMRVSASIRYTTDSDWLIARGRAVNIPRFGGYAQFRALSQLVRQHSAFTGRGFSWASNFIEQCAGGGSTGNLTSWRKVATNRHLARVAHQIASLP